MELRSRQQMNEMRTEARNQVFEQMRREGSPNALPANRPSPAPNMQDRSNAVILELNSGVNPLNREPSPRKNYGPTGKAEDTRVAWNPEEAMRQNAERNRQQIRENQTEAQEKIEERKEERRMGIEGAQERRDAAQKLLEERVQQAR